LVDIAFIVNRLAINHTQLHRSFLSLFERFFFLIQTVGVSDRTIGSEVVDLVVGKKMFTSSEFN